MARNLIAKLSLEDEVNSSTVEPVDEVALAATQQECDNCVSDISSTVDDMEEAQELQGVLEDKDADLVAAQEPGASEMDQAVAIAAANEALSLVKSRLGIQDSRYTVSYESYREGGSSLTTAINLSREGLSEIWEKIKAWIAKAIEWIAEKITNLTNLIKTFVVNLKKKESSLDNSVNAYGANGFELYVANMFSRVSEKAQTELKELLSAYKKSTQNPVSTEDTPNGKEILSRILKVIEGSTEFTLTPIDKDVLKSAIKMNPVMAHNIYRATGNMEEFSVKFLDNLKTGYKIIKENQELLDQVTSVVDSFLAGDDFDNNYINSLQSKLEVFTKYEYFPDEVNFVETENELVGKATMYDVYVSKHGNTEFVKKARYENEEYRFKAPENVPAKKTNSELAKYFHSCVAKYNSLANDMPAINKMVADIKKSVSEIDNKLKKLNMTKEKSDEITNENKHSLGGLDTKNFLDMYKHYLHRLVDSSAAYLKACNSIMKFLANYRISL